MSFKYYENKSNRHFAIKVCIENILDTQRKVTKFAKIYFFLFYPKLYMNNVIVNFIFIKDKVKYINKNIQIFENMIKLAKFLINSI